MPIIFGLNIQAYSLCLHLSLLGLAQSINTVGQEFKLFFPNSLEPLSAFQSFESRFSNTLDILLGLALIERTLAFAGAGCGKERRRGWEFFMGLRLQSKV